MIRNLFRPRSYITRRDDNPGGGGGGSPPAGGGGSSAPSASGPSPTPASTPSGGGNNPAPPASFRYDSNADPTPQQSAEVRGILEMERDPGHSLTWEQTRALLAHPMKFQTNKPVDNSVPDPDQPAPEIDPATGQPKAAPAAAATPQAPQLSPEVKAIVDALGSIVQQPQNQPGPQNPNEAPKPKKYYGEMVPAVQVSPELAGALLGPDAPAQSVEALNYMVNGIMNRIMDDTGRRMLEVAKMIYSTVPQMADARIQTQSTTEKFFGKYAELNRPAFHPVVSEVAQAVRAARQKAGKSTNDDEFIAEVGETVHKFLEQQMGKSFRPNGAIPPAPRPNAQPNPAPAPAPAPAPQGKFFTPGNARQDGGNHVNGKAQDWRDLVI